MPTKQQEKRPTDPEQQPDKLAVVIANYVMHALGQPSDFHRVQVRSLWENHYRVNVLVGTQAAFARVAHSYFLVADSNGNIVESIPKIAKQY